MPRKKARYLRDQGPTTQERIREVQNSYWGYRGCEIDIDTVIEADVTKQNYGYCGRPYYVDVYYQCRSCGAEYAFMAREQQVWFEEYGFYIDARPVLCDSCGKVHNQRKRLKEQYDSMRPEDDGSLSPQQAAELVGIMESLFRKPFTERICSRFNRLVKITAAKGE